MLCGGGSVMKVLRSVVFAGVLVAIGLGALHAQSKQSAAVLLEAANQKATLEGDLRGAIKIYEQVVNQFANTDRPAVAAALLRMGECYERLSDPQAARVFQRIVSQYADQAAPAAAARARLASGMPKAICEECGDPLGSISADGRLMLTAMPYMNGGERGGDIGVMELASGKMTPLEIEGSGKNSTGIALTGVFSPDARNVVYAWIVNEATELRIAPRQPKGKVRVLVGAGADVAYGIKMPLGWSQTGSILAIGQNKDQTLDLFLANVSTGAISRIKPLGFRAAPAPHIASISADGRYVAYEQFTTDPGVFTNLNRSAALERQIHVIAADGSGDVQVTTGAGIKRWPVWTPTGSHVLYLSNVAGAWDLWAIPMRGGKPAGAPSLVKKNLGEVASMGVSSAGIYHYYEGRSGVFKTTIASVGGSKTTAAESFVGTLPAWSPDGTKVAISRPRTSGPGSDVIIRTVANGDERVYRRDQILGGFPFIWLPDGTGLLVQVRESPNEQFWYRLNLADGTFTRLVQQRGNPAFWTHQNVRTISADGRTLFFGTYANQKDSELDRITALDLQTGNYRDVVKLPVEKASLPTAAQDIVLAASPDGKSLAVMFYDHKNKHAHLAVVGIDGQGYRELLPKVDASTLRNKLAWSRDGRWIYFPTHVGKPEDETFRIMRIAAAGGTPEVAGPDVIGLECISLNPDGTRLAYSTLRPEGWGQLLWSLDVAWLMKGSR